MDNEFMKRKNFAAKVEDMMKLNIDKDKAVAFDFDDFLNQFEITGDTFNNLIASPKVDVLFNERFQKLMIEAEEKTALKGTFDPEELFTSEVEEEDKERVLSLLAPDCIVKTVVKVEWFLHHKKRVEVIRRMIKEGKLDQPIIGEFPQTDSFGQMLQMVLIKGHNIELTSLNTNEILALTNVLEAIYDLDIPKPELNFVKEFLPNPYLTDYKILSQGFVGRKKELEELHNFLTEPLLDQFEWQGLVITGLGGAGKSTLLAEFIKDVLSKAAANAVVLDFDRPGINPNDIAWLELEISKQIAEQYRQHRRRLREAGKMTFLHYEDLGLESSEQSARHSKGLIEDAKHIMLNSTNNRTFLLILDTVEEISQRDLIDTTCRWIQGLADNLSPLKLKVIFSGRLYNDQLEKLLLLLPNKEKREFTIGAFDKITAYNFLVQQGLSNETAREVISSNVVPLRPLELKLIARLLKDGSVTVNNLKEELKESSGNNVTEELFMGLIYRRVLKRVNDPIVNTIACPGLILRYVTSDLILHVLKPALRLQDISEKQAKDIIEKLASFSWLAYQKDGKVWHRKDLRRTMLNIMIAKEAICVQAIRDAAIAFFDAQNTPEANAESMYHRLMMITKPEDGANLQLVKLKEAYKYIEENIADLPRAAAVLLKFAANRKIDESDINLLPDQYFIKAYEKVGRKLVSARQFDKAFELYKKGKQLGILLEGKGKGILDKWEKELLFCIGSWEALRQLPTYMLKNYGNQVTLGNVVDYLYPAGVIEPNVINRKFLEKLLDDATEDEEKLQSLISGPENISILTRLSYCLANLHKIKRLSEDSRESIKKIVRVLLNSERIPSLERNLIILNSIVDGTMLNEFKPGISYLKLDPEWVTGLTQIVPKNLHTLIEITADKFVNQKELSANNLLSKIDGDQDIRMLWRETSIELKNLDKYLIYDIARGPDTLFRDPCRYAIIDAIEHENDCYRLGEIIQSLLKVKLSDLRPGVFAKNVSNNKEKALEPFIELIDRSWAMGDFLREANNSFPLSDKIRNVKLAYENWEETLRFIFVESKIKRPGVKILDDMKAKVNDIITKSIGKNKKNGNK